MSSTIRKLLDQMAAKSGYGDAKMMLEAKQTGSANPRDNTPTPGYIPQSLQSSPAPVHQAPIQQPSLPAPTQQPALQFDYNEDLNDLVGQYAQNTPYASLYGASPGRSSEPRDPEWWYSYGMGPEHSFFSENQTPSPAPTTPAPSPAAPPASSLGPISSLPPGVDLGAFTGLFPGMQIINTGTGPQIMLPGGQVVPLSPPIR